MVEKFNTILSVILIPQTIELIIKNEKYDEVYAMNEFYNSKTYEMLSKEETKMWHFSALTIYTMWKHEKTTTEVVFPED